MLICWIVIYPMDSIIQSILSVQTYRHTLNTDTSLLQTVCFVPLHFLYKRNPNNHTPLSILMGFDWGQVHVAAPQKRSHQWCVSLTPKNTKTSGRMTCHCFLQHARKGRELPSSSYTACWLFNIYLEQTVNAFMVWESDFMYICVALWKANLQAMITLRYFILLNWIWIAVQSIVTISNVNLIITSVCKIHEKLMHNLIPTK